MKNLLKNFLELLKSIKIYYLEKVHSIKVNYGYRHPEQLYDEVYMGNVNNFPVFSSYKTKRVGTIAYNICGYVIEPNWSLVPWFVKRKEIKEHFKSYGRKFRNKDFAFVNKRMRKHHKI